MANLANCRAFAKVFFAKFASRCYFQWWNACWAPKLNSPMREFWIIRQNFDPPKLPAIRYITLSGCIIGKSVTVYLSCMGTVSPFKFDTVPCHMSTSFTCKQWTTKVILQGGCSLRNCFNRVCCCKPDFF